MGPRAGSLSRAFKLAAVAALSCGLARASHVFDTPVTIASGAAVSGSVLHAVDVDGDGDLDLVWLAGTSLRVNLGLGDGSFSSRPAVGTGLAAAAGRLAVGDLTGDGRPEAVVGPGAGSTQAAYLVNDGAGGFVATTLDLPRAGLALPYLGDVDADGDLDLYFVGQGVTIFRNDAGALNLSSDLPAATTLEAHEIQLGDMDGDGRADLVVGALDGGTGVDVLFAGLDPLSSTAGIGEIVRVQTILEAGASMTLDDLDGEGDLDVVLHGTILGTSSSAVRVLRNDGARRITPFDFAASLAREGGAPEVLVGDFDADGDRDVLIGCGGDASCRMLLLHAGDGAGHVDDVVSVGVVGPARRLLAADYDCDGRVDVVAGAAGIVTLDSVPGGFLDELAFPEGGSDLVLADFDADGQLDVATLSASALTVATGHACFAPTAACSDGGPTARLGADRTDCVAPGGVTEFRLSGGSTTPGAAPIGRYCWTTDSGVFVSTGAAFQCSDAAGATLRLANLASGNRANVTLEVADLSGCTSTDSAVVATDSAPIFSQAGTSLSLACAGVAFDLTARATALGVPSGLVRFEWDFDVARDSSGNTIADDDVDATVVAVSGAVAVVRATYDRPGSYTARVTARRNPDGACTATRDVAITVASPPQLTNVSGPVNTCAGVAAHFRATLAAGSTGVAVTWDFDERIDLDGNGDPGDDIEAVGVEVDWAFLSGGLRRVRATARAAGGCADSLDRVVNVFPAPVASFTAETVSCDIGIVTFRDTSTGSPPLLVFWDFGDGDVATGAVTTHPFSGPGFKVVTQRVVDGFGCEVTNSQPVFVGRSALSVAGITVLDGVDGQGSGNANGFPDPGETVRLRVDVQNGSVDFIADGVASLRVVSPTTGVTVTRPSILLSFLQGGDVVSTFPPHLELTLSDAVRCGSTIALEVSVSGGSSCATTEEVTLQVGLPSLVRYHPDQRVSETGERSSTPDSAFGGGQHFTVFADEGGGFSQVLLARHLSNGTLVDPTIDVSASGIPADQPRIAWAPEVRQFAVTWRESFAGSSGQVAFARLDTDGRTIGIPLRIAAGIVSSPDVTWTGEAWVLAWAEGVLAEVRAMSIGADGLPLSQPQRVSSGLDMGVAGHRNVRLASSGGTWLVASTRSDTGGTTVRARAFDASFLTTFVALGTADLGPAGEDAPAVDALSSGYLVAWADATSQVRVALIDETGVLRVSELVGPGGSPAIAVGRQFAVVAWTQGDEVLARGVARTGAVFATPVAVSSGDGASVTPAVSAGADGLFLAAWEDLRPPHPSSGEIYVGVIQPGIPANCVSGLLGDLAPVPGGDGVVNVGDVIVALRISVGLEPVTADALARGDVAPGVRTGSTHRVIGDGQIDIGDVVVLLQASTGQVTLTR